MVCNKKHIANPIPWEDWKCPKCESVDDFACWDIEDMECEYEHPDDYASCIKCGYGASLGTITKNYWKKKNIKWIKCPHCNGTGQVSGE